MSGSIIPFAISGKGAGVLQSVDIEGSSHTIQAEGHPAFGGQDSAPSPLDLVLASLVSCTQVTGQIVASQISGATLGKWEVSLESHLDNSVLVYGAEGISNFSDVSLSIAVESDLDTEQFAHFVSEVERRCPIAQLFRGSAVALKFDWRNTALAA